MLMIPLFAEFAADRQKKCADVTKGSWRIGMKLSIKIDNFTQAVRSMNTAPDDLPRDALQKRRQAAMAVLAHSMTEDITRFMIAVTVPAHDELRAAENGLVMVRGRTGGDGAPFNLGEATVSRAAVRLASGEVGIGYTLGRDREKARLIALCDAMIQTADHADAIETHVLTPLRNQIVAARAQKASETAATRVDFYTLVRGEN
jgi:alpha-D-ribose 1-methylphosphonate 5-triphosphate synthase subunit PhnG